MRMKCFNAESMPEAIRLVRGELGDNAIIISSQRGENGHGIRVTAAIEGFDPDPEPPAIDEPLDAIQAIANALDRHGTPGDLAESLSDELHAARLSSHGALTLIDTGGVNPFDANEVRELEQLLRAIDADIVLVMPAGYDCEEAAETAGVFYRAGAHRLLVTRLDAARRLGSVLVAADSARLKFCDFSVTPHVAVGW